MAEQRFGTVGERPTPSDPGPATRGAQSLPPAGWFPDPSGHARLRFWSGAAWTAWLSDGSTVWADAAPAGRTLDASDLTHLEFVERVLIPRARAESCITADEEALLSGLVTAMRAESVGSSARATRVTRATPQARVPGTRGVPRVPGPAPATPTTPGTPARRAMPAMPPMPAVPVVPREPRPPSSLALWWGRTKESVGSDLALHGLAYLGVLLFFVGAFGLVVFAFGDVAPALRPLAEVVIALVPFAAAALLLRRGATVVGRALEVVGGLLLPVMLVTSFLDDVAFPPDLDGPPLVIALTALTSLVAVSYAVWSGRHPDSALRYLVAPVAWLAVAMAALGLGPREIPDGKAVATPSAAQCAAMAAALVATLAWTRLRPDHRLAAPTRAVSLPGLLVIAALSLLTWVAEGWPFIPALVTGVLVVVALELLSDRMPATALGVAEPLWWGLVSVALARSAADLSLDAGAVATLAAAGFLTLLEVAGAARRPALALALPATGLAMALVATTVDPWWAVATFGLATVWACWRRMTPFRGRGAAGILDATAATLPVLALLNLAAASDVPSALLAGAFLVLLAAVVARWSLLDRSPGDRFWSLWWGVAGVATLVVTLATLAVDASWSTGEQWSLVAALAGLTASSAVGPLGARWRAPVVTGAAGVTWLSAAGILDLTTVAVTTPLAVAGLAMVVLAHARPRLVPTSAVASLGLTGHGLGVVGVVLAAGPGWAPVLATGLATAGWSVTGWLDARGRSEVGASLTRLARWVGWVPLAIGAGGIPVTVSLGLDRAGLLALDDPASVAVPVAAAVAYAVASRLPLPDRVVAVSAWAGFLVAVVASAWATTLLGAAVGLAAIPAAVLLLRPQRRTRGMTWTAWVVLAPVAGLLAAETWPWFGSLPFETACSLTLVTVGSLLRVGGAAADLRGRGWTPHLLPSNPAALPPVVLGAAELALGLWFALMLVPADVSGWVFAGAAVVLLVTAVLSRAGVIAGAAALAGWVAVLLLALPTLEALPWVAVVVALALLLAAEGLSRLPASPQWWARWDLPLLAAAAPVGVSALVVAADGPYLASTCAAVGAECLAAAARLRHHRVLAMALGTTGTVLVLAGAGTAGTGWLALALLGLSVALTWLATTAEGSARTALQVGGAVAAVATWQTASAWLDLPGQRAADLTALTAAALAAAVAAAALRTRLDRSWVLVWGGTAVLVEAVCALGVLIGPDLVWPGAEPSWPVAAGLGIAAASIAAGASAVGIRWLRDVAVAFGLGALLVAMLAAGLSTTQQVGVVSLLSVSAAVATLTVSRRPSATRWLRPLLELGGATTLWALVAAATAPSTAPSTPLLVLALSGAAVQAAATGVALRSTLLQLASPVLACVAWLVFSAEALDGNPQWVTVPIGLATLVVVSLWRRDRAEHAMPVASPEIVGLELVGIAFLAGASVVQAVTESVGYAVLVAAVGLAVAAWGAVSRVRRRLAAGLGLVVLAVALLVGVPLVSLLPSWEGAGLWVLIGGVGLVVILVAVFLEQGKAAAHSGLARFEEATSGWE